MKWINIEKQKPEFDLKVLTWNGKEPDEPARTDTLKSITTSKKGEILNWYENSCPTHWMPLPKPPKQ